MNIECERGGGGATTRDSKEMEGTHSRAQAINIFKKGKKKNRKERTEDGVVHLYIVDLLDILDPLVVGLHRVDGQRKDGYITLLPLSLERRNTTCSNTRRERAVIGA